MTTGPDVNVQPVPPPTGPPVEGGCIDWAETVATPGTVRRAKRETSPPVTNVVSVSTGRDATASEEPGSDDQDLLFATIRRPWTMPFAPLTTEVHDYLGNHYFAVSPFEAGVGHRAYLRLRPEPSSAVGENRNERLVSAVARGPVTLHLEIGRDPFGPWSPLVRVQLEAIAEVDGEALRFRPFRDGRGLTPTGFVHALRIEMYSLSQRARP